VTKFDNFLIERSEKSCAKWRFFCGNLTALRELMAIDRRSTLAFAFETLGVAIAHSSTLSASFLATQFVSTHAGVNSNRRHKFLSTLA